MSFSRQKPPGISFGPAYEVSGVPYVSSSMPNEVGAAAVRINFPFVTRWVEVINTGNDELRIGFSKNGAEGKGAVHLPDERIYSGSMSEPVANVSANGRRNYFKLGASGSAGKSQGRVRWELRCGEIFFTSPGTTSFSICAGLTTIPAGQINLTGSLGFMGVGYWPLKKQSTSL